jgi:hypothetical protein
MQSSILNYFKTNNKNKSAELSDEMSALPNKRRRINEVSISSTERSKNIIEEVIEPIESSENESLQAETEADNDNWNEDQVKYYADKYKWLKIHRSSSIKVKDRLSCTVCQNIQHLGIHNNMKGIKIAKEWVNGTITASLNGTRRAKQKSLRNKIE